MGYLPVVLIPCCNCQRSKVLLKIIIFPPLFSADGFLAFEGVCDWISDVATAVELLDLMLLLLWSSWITTWKCLVSHLEFLDHVAGWCYEDAVMNGKMEEKCV